MFSPTFVVLFHDSLILETLHKSEMTNDILLVMKKHKFILAMYVLGLAEISFSNVYFSKIVGLI